MLVDIDNGKGGKVDRIRAERPTAVVLVRIEDLVGQRLPPPGGAAIERARPRRAYRAKACLDLRDEIIGDGISVWTQVR